MTPKSLGICCLATHWMASRLAARSIGMLPSSAASTSKLRAPVFLSKKTKRLEYTETPLLVALLRPLPFTGGVCCSNLVIRFTKPSFPMRARRLSMESTLDLRSYGATQADTHGPLGLLASRDFVKVELHPHAV